MPLYEEKLISPLAIRFTQQRIRTTFRDGYEVEATIKEITTADGIGDYDIILEAPFPAIEIIRWAPNGRSSADGEHWFSFDNRRLYCLQRIAAKYWPKRVGATVEVLYADSGTIRKKLDSQTLGQSVSIGHAFAAAGELKEWSWRKTVLARCPLGSFQNKAEASVAADGAKTSVRELTNAPVLSAFERLARAEAAKHLVRAPEDDEEQEVVSAEETKDNSLGALIGQLMVLRKVEDVQPSTSSEDVQPREHVSDDERSTHLSEHTEGIESSPSASSSDPKVASGGEEEEEQEVPQECQAKAQKAARTRTQKVAKQTRAAWEAQAHQYQMCQMAQWQQAQWQQAQMCQMAQWQQASMTAAQYQAQAAQMQAAQMHGGMW